jgi:flagellar biogenesis protein FliO
MEASLVLRALAVLAIVGGLLVALRYLATSIAAHPRGNSRRMLQVVESAALPGACSLHLVAVAGHRVVIGRSTSQLTLLYEFPRDESRPYAHSDRR